MYNIDVTVISDTTVKATVGFGDAADNDKIVLEADALANQVANDVMGKIVLVTGRASLPVAFALSHAWAHITKAIAIFDPKLNQYVVAVSHGADVKVGDLI